jgi:hypothetical protein
MKSFFAIVLFTAISIFSSCDEKDLVTHTLLGKWELADTYLSIGGPLIYKKASEENQIVLTFKNSGELSSSDNIYKAYRLKDSVTVTFIKKNDSEEDYFFRIDSGLLNLSPRGKAMCIEGCGSRYRKLK